jgi:tellurite methyltransferase
MNLVEQFGHIDIYLFDQLLRGRIASASAAAGRYGETSPQLATSADASEGGPGYRIFDAGCGGGRNLVYLLRSGYEVCGNDSDAAAIAQVLALAASLGTRPSYDFRVEAIEATSFPDRHADVVIASAVLHFARDEAHFEAMLRQLWRVLRPGGVFFARLASSIGITGGLPALGGGSAFAAEGRSGEISPEFARVPSASGGGRYRLPDGSDRFLVDAAMIESWTIRLGGVLIDPIKTTVVHEQRSMTTWVARRDKIGG